MQNKFCGKNRKITKKEWKEFAKRGEQLDTVLAKSVMIESIFLTMRCIQMENSLRLSEITQERKNKVTFKDGTENMEEDMDAKSISNLGEQILQNYQPDFLD